MSSPLERLVDARTGLIRALEPDPPRYGTPRSYLAYTAYVGDTGQFAEWRADPCGHGGAFDDERRAQLAAVGEAVERYCGNAVPPRLVRSSYVDLFDEGREAVDPGTVALYSPRQYAHPGFPFVPLTRSSTAEWTCGRDMTTGQDILVPACLTYLNYRDPAGEPITLQMYAGIAAGHDASHAESAALEELLERDALSIWWLSGAPAVEIDAGMDARIATWLADMEEAGSRGRLYWLRSSFEVPVVGALVQDAEQVLMSWGVACRADPREAAHKALVEAIDGLLVARELLDPRAAVWHMTGTAERYAHAFRPYRADRRYRQDFRADYRDITDLAMHTQFYLDPESQQRIAHRFVTGSNPTPLCEIPALPKELGRDGYVKRLQAHGIRAIAVDLTTLDVRAAGLHVVRVVAPGLASYAPAAFPLLGARRLYEVPTQLGWQPTPLAEDDLVLEPLPYS